MTREEQANNRRSSLIIKYRNESHTLAEWSKIFGIKYKILWQRINRDNMEFSEAINNG